MNAQEYAQLQINSNRNNIAAAAGLFNIGFSGARKEKPRLRYLRGQWMQITDRREQYYVKRNAHDDMIEGVR